MYPIRRRNTVRIIVFLAISALSPMTLAGGQGFELVLTEEPKPGDKLGLPYDEAAAALDAETKQFLDGVLKTYRTPGLIGNRRQMYKEIGATPETRTYFTPEGQPEPTFREDIASIGIFSRKGWQAWYWYDGIDQKKGTWSFRFQVDIDTDKATCINSRAVEGYMDIHWKPIYIRTFHKPYVLPSEWNRHGAVGRLMGDSLEKTSPELRASFIKGCLSMIQIAKSVQLKEMKNDAIYK